MKVVLIAALVATAGLISTPSDAISMAPQLEQRIAGHGGGCRKSSPPGQCCHMDRKVGVVHCH